MGYVKIRFGNYRDHSRRSPYKICREQEIRYAIERLLLIIGEAANHVSVKFREQHPEIEWAQVIGMRNVLAHEYGEVKTDKIYFATTKSIPVLLASLASLVQE